MIDSIDLYLFWTTHAFVAMSCVYSFVCASIYGWAVVTWWRGRGWHLRVGVATIATNLIIAKMSASSLAYLILHYPHG